jgi:hypothetical protein
MHTILTLHEKVRTGEIARRKPEWKSGATDVESGHFLTDDEGGDTDDARTHTDEDTAGWTPERPDAVRLGTPKRNPVIARSVGEPL